MRAGGTEEPECNLGTVDAKECAQTFECPDDFTAREALIVVPTGRLIRSMSTGQAINSVGTAQHALRPEGYRYLGVLPG